MQRKRNFKRFFSMLLAITLAVSLLPEITLASYGTEEPEINQPVTVTPEAGGQNQEILPADGENDALPPETAEDSQPEAVISEDTADASPTPAETKKKRQAPAQTPQNGAQNEEILPDEPQAKAQTGIETGQCGPNATWELNLDTGDLKISGTGKIDALDYPDLQKYYNGYVKTLEIKPGITEIGYIAFKEFKNMTQAILPDTVTKIGSDAFYKCDSLQKINIPDSVEGLNSNSLSSKELKTAGPIGGGYNIEFGWTDSIPKYAFYGASYLEEVTLPESISRIEFCAFSYTDALKKINFPESLTHIGDFAFGCCGLTRITIPANVTSIDRSAFSGIDTLKTAGPIGGGYDFEFGWTDAIPDNTFSDCTALTKVTLPDGVTRIGSQAFYLSGLKEISFPKNLTHIGESAFRCTPLEEAILPDSITEVGDYAFYDVPSRYDTDGGDVDPIGNLKKLRVPASLTTIGYYAFSNAGLKTAGPIGGGYDFEFGWTDSFPGEIFNYCGALTEITLPVNITSIDDSAFSGCTSLTKVTIPKGVTSIGNYAFQDCEGLTEITIPESVTSIGDSAFNGCKGLTKINIPKSVTSIGNYAFGNCEGLTEVTIPDNITSISDGAFAYCTALTKISIPDNVSSIGMSAFCGCTGLTEVTIPDNVSSIGDGAFAYCERLTKINIPDNVTLIGNATFCYCKGLTEIKIPVNVTSINFCAFFRCEGLKKIIIPDNVTHIDNWAFRDSGLTDVTFSEGLTHIGECAFRGAFLTEAILPDSIKEIGDYAFCGSDPPFGPPFSLSDTESGNAENTDSTGKLKKVRIPSTLTKIGINVFADNNDLKTAGPIGGGYDFEFGWTDSLPDNAFNGLNSLSEIHLTEQMMEMTSLGNGVFQNCSSLTKLAIPPNISSIGDNAFNGCSGLKTLIIPRTVNAIGREAFSNHSESFKLKAATGSYGETYARENNIPCITATTLTLAITDQKGASLPGSFKIIWQDFAGEALGEGSPITVPGDLTEVTYRIELDEAQANAYLPPKEQTVPLYNVAEERLELTCALEEIGQVAIAGKVAGEDGQGLPGAAITLTQTVGGKKKTIDLTADANGRYSASIQNLPTTGEIQADGYYKRRITVIADRAAGDIDLGTETLLKLPKQKIRLNLRLTSAAASGEASTTTALTNANGLTFALRNKTQDKEITGFSVQYPYLVLEEGAASPADVIAVTATDKNDFMTADPAEAKLDGQGFGSVTIDFLQNGFFTAGLLGDANETAVLVFDQAGVLLEKEITATQAFTSAPLPQGNYQAAFMENTALLPGISQISDLQQSGLKESDYVTKNISISNGKITDLGNIRLPALDEEQRYCLDKTQTFLTASQSTAVAGQWVMLTAKYQVKPGYAASDCQVKLKLPQDTELRSGSVTVGGKPAASYSYDEQNNTLTVPTGSGNGNVKCYITPLKGGAKDISANLRFFANGSPMEQPVGTAHFTAESATIHVPERKADEKNITVTGKAVPKSTIRVFDNGQPVKGTAQANAVGSWSLNFDLLHPYSYSYHDIYAEVKYPGSNGKTLTTDTATLLYDTSVIEVSKVTMYNRGDRGQNETVFDFLHPGKPGSYRMWPGRYTSFTFVIDFTGNASLAEDVTLCVYMKSGNARRLNAAYDSVKKAWVACGEFSVFNDAPVNVGVSYFCDGFSKSEECSAASHPDAPEETEKFLENLKRQLNDRMEVSVNKDTADAAELAFSLTDDDNAAWDMEIEKLNYADYDTGTLEKDGFVLCETQYLKAEANAQGIVYTLVDTEQEYACAFRVPLDLKLPSDEQTKKTARKAAPKSAAGQSGSWILQTADALLNASPSVAARTDYQNMSRMLCQSQFDVVCRREQISGLLSMKCKDGQAILAPEAMKQAQSMLASISNQQTDEYMRLEEKLSAYKQKLAFSTAISMISLGLGQAFSKTGNALSGITLSGAAQKNLEKMCAALFHASKSAGLRPFQQFAAAGSACWMDIKNAYAELDRQYKELEDYIRQNERCPGEILYNYANHSQTSIGASGSSGNTGSSGQGQSSWSVKSPDIDKVPILDPSGYVCEAVSSNRLADVTATIYYRKNDQGGDGAKWDAAEYDQKNPLTTFADGSYAWDVPEGQWRVKYEKEGYQTAYSDWMPVPPPQTEVNIAMTANAAPQIERVNAYNDNVKITFSQYMDIESVKADSVAVTANGQKITGTVAPYDAEPSLTKENGRCAKTFVFTPDKTLSGEIRVRVAGTAANYAGKTIGTAYETNKTIQAEPKSLEADSIQLLTHTAGNLEVQIAPAEAAAAGLIITAQSFTPAIVTVQEERVQADADGKAVIALNGQLPGAGEILLSLEGTDITKSVEINVTSQLQEACEKVTASPASGTAVQKGTKVTLSTATEGAQIYYTLDGSCPCETDSPSRKKYSEPLAITQDTQIIAYAVKEGMADSPAARFSYTIAGDATVEEPLSIQANDQVDIALNAEAQLTCRILPAQAGSGRTVTAESLAPDIVSVLTQSVTAASDGSAALRLKGLKKGTAVITLTIAGTAVTKKITAAVTDAGQTETNICAAVSANIKSGSSVRKGTKVILSTNTPGADIYYTLDGSDPCSESSQTRMKYTDPLTLTKDTTIRACAAKKGMRHSDAAEFTYKILKEPERIQAQDHADLEPQTEITVSCQILPKEAATGLTVTATSSAPDIVSAPTDALPVDENGSAAIKLKGLKTGTATVTLAITGTDIAKEITVSVAKRSAPPATNVCAAVSANIKSGSSVKKGTKVILSTNTSGADIYYTLDGSDPRKANNRARKKYAKPLTIAKAVKIKACAVKKGMADSAVTVFSYRIQKAPSAPQKKLKKGNTFTLSGSGLKFTVTKAAKGKTPGQAQVKGLNGKKTKVTIPAKVTAPATGEAFLVTSIGAKAFKNHKKLATAKIGNNVQTIGSQAFYGCKKLKSVTLGTGVRTIGSRAFCKCGKLAKITVKSKKLHKVGSQAITGIHKKAKIKVPARKLKAYKKKFSKKTGKKATMKIVK